jgi:hypothetical protein
MASMVRLRPYCALEAWHDLVGGVGPDHGAGLGQGVTRRAALGQLQVDVTTANIDLDDFDPHPFAGPVGLGHGLGDAGQELGQADALGGHGQFGRSGGVLRTQGCLQLSG